MIAALAGLAVALVVLWGFAMMAASRAERSVRELRVEVERWHERRSPDEGRDAPQQ